MVAKRAKNMTTAKARAAIERKKGLIAVPFKKKKGFGVSVTRK